MIQFLLRLDIFQTKNIMSNRKNIRYGKITNIVAFSSRRPYATKYSPFKDLHCIQNFSCFHLKMGKLLIKNCFVKVKINLDIMLSEITLNFDNGVVKR